MVEDRTVTALIDLGSEATLVRKSSLKGMGNVCIKECRRSYKGVSGKSLDVIGEVLIEVNVTPKIITSHIAVVVPDHLLETNLLMGADLLGKYDVGWSAARGIFTWAGFQYRTGSFPMPRILRLAGSIRRISIVSTNKEEIENKFKNIHLDKKVTLRKRSVTVVKLPCKVKTKFRKN